MNVFRMRSGALRSGTAGDARTTNFAGAVRRSLRAEIRHVAEATRIHGWYMATQTMSDPRAVTLSLRGRIARIEA